MKRPAFHGGILLGAAVAAIIASCSVNTRTDGLVCSATASCASGHVCVGGYCIVSNCPAACTSCDEAAHTCAIDCSTTATCGNVSCPAGWICTITCTGTGACQNITCGANTACAIDCAGTSSCSNIGCAGSCKCDVTCPTGDCASTSCPVVGNGANQVRCTVDGTPGSPCDSAKDSRCVSCVP